MLNKALLLCGGQNPLTGVLGSPVSSHGFTLQRHISNEATVITYKAADGKIKRMAVKDAKFRSVLQFGAYNVDVPGLTNFQSSGVNGQYVAGSEYIGSSSPMPASVTNNAIFNNWQAILKSDKTARENCDIWMTYKNKTDSRDIKGVPAVEWCRAQKLSGRPCDLPNEYQLICIWACGDKLDEMDPTKGSYPDLRLGYTSGRRPKYNGTYAGWMFSSTEHSSESVRGVLEDGSCSGGSAKVNFGGVVPVLEIDL